MKRVYVASDLPRAQLVVDLLEQNGIAARVLNEHASTLSGEIPVLHATPHVWVEQDRDEAAARSLVEALEQRVSSEAVQQCGACGEENPDSFELCWNCGADLVAAEG